MMYTNQILSISVLSFFLISCSTVSMVRPESVAVENVNYDILYEGYPNKVRLAVFGHKNEDIYLNGRGLSVSKADEVNSYIIKPTIHEEEVFLDISVIRKNDTILLRTINYFCTPIPDPIIYWGSKREGAEADIKSKYLWARYSDFPFPMTTSIKKWEMRVDSVELNSKGSNLTSAEKFLNELKQPTIIYFKIHYLLMDSEKRVKEVYWKINPSKE